MTVDSKVHGFELLEAYRVKMKLSRTTFAGLTGISADLLRDMQKGRAPHLIKARGIHVLQMILTLTGRRYFEAGSNSDVRSDIDAWAYYRDYMIGKGYYQKDAAVKVGLTKYAFSAFFTGWYAEDQSHDGFGLLTTLSSLYNEPVFVGSSTNET